MKFDFKSFKFDASSLKLDPKAVEAAIRKLSHPSAAGDLGKFLEKLPVHAGNTMLMIAGVAWAVAGGAGLFATIQAQQLTDLRAKLEESKALQPIVPQIVDVAIAPAEVTKFAEELKDVYSGVQIQASGSEINISSANTANFGQFREAVGHIQNGGSGWRVSVGKLCVGRECQGPPLQASLKINKVDVQAPAPAVASEAPAG
jgi:hypothetical protein